VKHTLRASLALCGPLTSWILALAFTPACSGVDQGVIATQGPSTTNFANVNTALALRCGSLECHGTKFRNMRVFGYGALRLRPEDAPDVDTRPEEVLATYQEIVGLEPELMNTVAREKVNPQRLSLIRKSQGFDNHKGGLRLRAGSDFERCLFSWLAGGVDVPACQKASISTAM
jgi:hypothetical protein